MDAPRILVLAGEASGDHHAAAVVREVRALRPGARFVGLGGPALETEGVDLLEGLDRLAVMGFVEVAARISFFRRLEHRLVALLEAGGIDLVLAVDYPGLNLRIARRARRLGVPVVYYIAPQVWAWKAHRAARLAEDCERVAVILPFEAEPLRTVGARAVFVGHPLAELDGSEGDGGSLRAGLGLARDAELLAVLPGSRRQELDRHLAPFVSAARRIATARPGLVPVLAAAPGVDVARLTATGLPVTRDARLLLREARAGIVKSGTSTLEAAVAGCPFVCAYRTSPLTWMLARRLVRVPYIALANLVAGRGVVPELLQQDATPSRIAAAVLPLLEDGPVRSAQCEGLAAVRTALGGPGAAGRTAALVDDVLAGRPWTEAS